MAENSIRPLRMLAIGGMNLDVLADAADPYREGDSLRGRVQFRPGGVARNVASHLARAGARVELMTALGNDGNARLLAQSCLEEGISLTYSMHTVFSAPVYVAVHDPLGEMRCAVNDMRAMESLTAGFILGSEAFRQPFDAVFLDANLSLECLAAATASVKAPLVADPVSLVKCERLRGLLPSLAALKPNRIEAEALTSETDPARQAAALLNMGVKAVYISLGEQGVYYADREDRGLLPAKAVPHKGLTGAGDAMAAGIAAGVAKGFPARETALLGLQFSAHHLEEIAKTPFKEEPR